MSVEDKSYWVHAKLLCTVTSIKMKGYDPEYDRMLPGHKKIGWHFEDADNNTLEPFILWVYAGRYLCYRLNENPRYVIKLLDLYKVAKYYACTNLRNDIIDALQDYFQFAVQSSFDDIFRHYVVRGDTTIMAFWVALLYFYIYITQMATVLDAIRILVSNKHMEAAFMIFEQGLGRDIRSYTFQLAREVRFFKSCTFIYMQMEVFAHLRPIIKLSCLRK